METTISVVIPTFNRIDTLPRAIRSVQNQHYPVTEIIVVDDGSSDGTRQFLEQAFTEVVVVSQNNQGVSSARNRGIETSSGSWIAFLDSDDEWLPDKLGCQIKMLEENPDHKICHTDEIWVRRGTRVNPMKKHEKKGGWIFQHCLPLCAISPSSVLIHQSVFERCGNFDESLPACEDYDLWLRMTSRYPVLYVDRPMIVKYGGHGDQLSMRYWGMDRFRIRALEKVIASGRLNPADYRAACDTLVKKAQIYANGARKRNRLEDARRYDSVAVAYSRPRRTND